MSYSLHFLNSTNVVLLKIFAIVSEETMVASQVAVAAALSLGRQERFTYECHFVLRGAVDSPVTNEKQKRRSVLES